MLFDAFPPLNRCSLFFSHCGVAECVCAWGEGQQLAITPFIFLFFGCRLELEQGFRNGETVACGPGS